MFAPVILCMPSDKKKKTISTTSSHTQKLTMTSLSQSMESTTVSFSVVLGLKKYSQRVDCFMGAVHCGHVIWTRVVEHRVPIGQHQYSAGTDVKDAHWITHEQGDDGRHTALKQCSDVLEKSAGAGKTGAQAQPSQASVEGAHSSGYRA